MPTEKGGHIVKRKEDFMTLKRIFFSYHDPTIVTFNRYDHVYEVKNPEMGVPMTELVQLSEAGFVLVGISYWHAHPNKERGYVCTWFNSDVRVDELGIVLKVMRRDEATQTWQKEIHRLRYMGDRFYNEDHERILQERESGKVQEPDEE